MYADFFQFAVSALITHVMVSSKHSFHATKLPVILFYKCINFVFDHQKDVINVNVKGWGRFLRMTNIIISAALTHDIRKYKIQNNTP